ncbi:MFS transporter [Pseudobutyrivibrio sp.]|uniref:MFS transporter n=1 Tax=Pseudobutyrivibrio sp. TaxID=2014367 RepID=UPI001D59528E|nr:MFS transporter [Pseudobutyrivibrio sp.]MBE5910420.1 sugar transporter [Pseudobutyrivibrio sp.]
MGKEKTLTREDNGVVYKKAKTIHIALATMTGAAQMVFYMLMGAATYIGNANFGILVAITGFIITGSRLFDGITDPVIAFFIERFNSKFGKVRFSIMTGWGLMAIATTLMCNIGPKLHLTGFMGCIFFVFSYAIYIVGYTFGSIAGQINANVLTNDPKQRPTIGVWNTTYAYLTPMIMSVVASAVILPRFNNIQGTEYFATYNIVVIIVSFILYILACIGIAPYDIPENFEGLKTDQEKEKTTLKDMVALIKENKELQRFIVAATSDKLAQTIGSASVVSTMLFGIMIGSLAISSILSAVAMIPSIIFAIIGSRMAGKHGSKAVMIKWTWVCIVLNVFYAVYLLFAPTQLVGSIIYGNHSMAAIAMAIVFLLFTFGNNAVKMVVSVATGTLRIDIVDYELDRSGNYMPATVSAAYSFIDKIVSSLGATIATICVGFIGYTTTVPQQGDPLTLGIKIMTVILMIGFPIVGWICTLLAMKNSTISYERMTEIQKSIAEKKAALKQGV